MFGGLEFDIIPSAGNADGAGAKCVRHVEKSKKVSFYIDYGMLDAGEIATDERTGRFGRTNRSACAPLRAATAL
jgi:hypothetical protein